MQESYAESLLRSGIIEAKAGQKSTARRYLERALLTSDNHNHEIMAEAWFWMAQIQDEPAEKRRALESALSHDLKHLRARRELAILDGKIRPEEMINPDALPPTPEGFVQAEVRRFMCPKCGGRMSFAPDGQSLVCEYCNRRESLSTMPTEPREQDFFAAMATLRGHHKPLMQQVFHCDGCDAEFTLPPTLISAACLYCASPHVVKMENSQYLIAPDAVLPHAFDQKRATSHLAEWIENQKVKPDRQPEPPRGLYLPVWTFDLGGEIKYTGTVIRRQTRPGETIDASVHVEDGYPVQVNDLPVPASRNLAQVMSVLLPTFDLNEIKPYKAQYLADWPAEVYDVPMGDASLEARSQAFRRLKQELPVFLDPLKLISTSSQGMTVDSFKLALLPVWVARVSLEGRERLVLINGQKGAVAGDIAGKKGLLDRLADLFDD